MVTVLAGHLAYSITARDLGPKNGLLCTFEPVLAGHLSMRYAGSTACTHLPCQDYLVALSTSQVPA